MNNKRKKIKNSGNCQRKYHRMSTFTPDQQAFVNYLIQRGYDLTLKTFQQQIQDRFKYSYDYFQNLIQNGGDVSYEIFQSWVLDIQKSFRGKPNEFIKLQFMLLVWLFSSNSSKISEQNAKNLRNFIQQNGVKLSQFPELLPYFALPYCHDPVNHPFLHTIYTKKWKQEVKFLFNQQFSNQKQIFSNNLVITQQVQWYSIVKDLIQICSALDRQCTVKNNKHIQMFQRVKKYKKVIEDNDASLVLETQSIRAEELSRLVFYPSSKQQKLESVGRINEKVFKQINYQALKHCLFSLNFGKSNDHKQFCLIYYALHERIIKSQSVEAKVKLIKEYNQNDIFFLKDPTDHTTTTTIQQIECLKLISTMCGQNQFVIYLSSSLPFISSLIKIISHNPKGAKKQQRKDSGNQGCQQRLLEALSILQKISFKKQVVREIIKLDIICILIKDYINCYERISQNVLTYVLAIMLNIILQKEGKKICSSAKCQRTKISSKQFDSFFQQMVKIWKHFYKTKQNNQKEQFNVIQSQLESVIYSIFYVLLSVQSNWKIAKSINFKLMLEAFLSQNNDEYHQKVVTSILEIIKNGGTSTDIQASHNVFDWDCVEYGKNYLWVGDELIELSPSEVENIEQILQKFYISPQNIEKQIQNVSNNISAPLKIKNNGFQQQKSIANNSQAYDKIQNYDPNKYRSWKRLKTSNQ